MKLYNEEQQEQNVSVKPVVLRLRNGDEDGEVILSAVDENGEAVTDLASFSESRSYAFDCAIDSLKQSGYSTNFTEWNTYGGMLLEDE